jgi:hypothetical protein
MRDAWQQLRWEKRINYWGDAPLDQVNPHDQPRNRGTIPVLKEHKCEHEFVKYAFFSECRKCNERIL